MKKVMIGIIILIPILIVLIVGAVSNFVSLKTHIGVEEISLDKNTINLSFGDGAYDMSEMLEVTVLPEKASNPEFVWKIGEIKCLDPEYQELYENYLEHKDDPDFDGLTHPPVSLVDDAGNDVEFNSTGKIRIYAYCYFDLRVQAETREAGCLVYVSDEEVKSITITGFNSLTVGAISQLEYTFTPIDAIVREGEWESSDESVAVVDGNGVVRGVGEGSARIVMRAKKHTKDEYVESAGYEVRVSGGVSTRYGSEVSVDRTEFTLSELGLTRYGAGEYIGEGCEISGDGTVRMSGAEAKISGPDGKSMRIRQVEAGGIEIENGAVYGYEEGREKNYVLEAGGMPLSLRAVWSSVLASGSPTGAVWRSSNESVAEVDGSGRVSGVGDGIAEISCEANGKRAAIKVAVKEKITALVLEISDGSQEVGIARETVYGAKVYGASGETANGIDINIKIPTTPEGAEEREAFYRTFIFEVSDGEKAYFEGNRLVFVPGAIVEYTELEVTVRARYPKYESMTAYTTAKFTVKVSPGIEVYSYEELKAAAASDNEICLGANIRVPDYFFQASHPEREAIVIGKSIFGNNFTIDSGLPRFPVKKTLIRIKNSGVKLSNLLLRANQATGASGNIEDNVNFSGEILRVTSDGDYSDRITDTVLEYCILENASSAVMLLSADIFFNGSIIRNTNGTSIYAATGYDTSKGLVQYSHIRMRNCIMSNVLGTTINMAYEDYTAPGNDIEENIRLGYNTTFTQEGFLDIYNWQNMNALSLIPPGALDPALNDIVNIVLPEILLSSDQVARFRLPYNGQTYFHLGLMSVGFGSSAEISYAQCTFEDQRFSEFNNTMIDFPLLNQMPKCFRFWCYTNDISDVTPERSYTINSLLIDKLRGEVAPSQSDAAGDEALE